MIRSPSPLQEPRAEGRGAYRGGFSTGELGTEPPARQPSSGSPLPEMHALGDLIL